MSIFNDQVFCMFEVWVIVNECLGFGLELNFFYFFFHLWVIG